jgi:Ca2+-binding EF-hand superfamily protein
MQNVSLREAYHAFDEDGDGFITFTEFSKGLDLWLKLSFLAKQAFFSYLDTLKIGMFDFKRWENVMKRYVLDTSLAL